MAWDWNEWTQVMHGKVAVDVEAVAVGRKGVRRSRETGVCSSVVKVVQSCTRLVWDKRS